MTTLNLLHVSCVQELEVVTKL